MVTINKGSANELSLRLVLASDLYGRDYFDCSDDLRELLEDFRRLLASTCESTASDGIERAVTIAVVPKGCYGDDSTYGVGLSQSESLGMHK